MWNANSDDGKPVEIKLPESLKVNLKVNDILDEHITDGIWEKQEEVASVLDQKDIYVYCEGITLQINVDTKTGKSTIVGVDGHPIDFSKKLI